MEKSVEAKLAEDITAIERSNRIRVMSVVMAVLLVIGFVALFRPDLPKAAFRKSIEGFRNLQSKVESIKERRPEVKEEPVVVKEEKPEPKPGTVLEIGSAVNYKGREIILTYVNSKETYCMLRVDEESILITKGTERNVNGVMIEVLEPSTTPRETCRVMMR